MVRELKSFSLLMKMFRWTNATKKRQTSQCTMPLRSMFSKTKPKKGITLRDCLHSGNECLKNKVLEYIYDTLVNMFNCTFEDTNDGITGTDGLYAVSETFDKNLCNILGEDVPDSILQIALDMQTDNLTAVENKLEKMQVLGKTVNQKLISSLARTLEENNNGYLIAEAAFIISGGVTADCYSAFLAPNSYKLRAWPNQKQMKDIINHPERYAVFSIQFSY